MTRAELLELSPGRRMDELVATCVMGWRKARQGDQYPIDWDQWNTDEGPTGWTLLAWRPSVDIGAAWLAAERAGLEIKVIAGDTAAPWDICRMCLLKAMAGHDELQETT